MSARFQFVWWGWTQWRRPRVHRWEGWLARIYRYSLVCGPLEIRRWNDWPVAPRETEETPE